MCQNWFATFCFKQLKILIFRIAVLPLIGIFEAAPISYIILVDG